MNYAEIKTALRSFQAQGQDIPALNSKKEVLEAALAKLQAATAAPEIVEETAPETIVATTAQAIAPTTPIPAPDTTPIAPTRRSLIFPVKGDIKFVWTTLIWAIALIRSLIRFSTPYAIRGAELALRIAVYTAVLFQVWIFPKLILAAYTIGLWGVQVALSIRNRRGAIA